jgi:hypothetical protein
MQATLPVVWGWVFRVGDGRGEVPGGGLAFELLEERPGLVRVRRGPAESRESVRGDGHVALQGHAAGDVLGVGIEAPVLVDDDDPGVLAAALGPGRVGPHLAVGGRVLDIPGLETGVVGRDELAGRRRPRLETGQERGCGGRAPGDPRQAGQEIPAADPAPRILPIKADDLAFHG